MDHAAIHIRPLAQSDSFDALTLLLNSAYAPLAAAGMNFTAATQSAADTARRAGEGHCLVALRDHELVGTATVAGPYTAVSASPTAGAPWFHDGDTAHLHQLAVAPALQRRGLGLRLIAECERWAQAQGYNLLALDTAEPATELRAMYARLGYADVGHVQWQGKAYRSVVMRKVLGTSFLGTSPLRAHLATMARYNLWATQKLYAHVDALPEDDYRRDAGLFFNSVHGTLAHLLVGEHLLWFQRFAHGESPVLALNSDTEPDRARLRQRLLEGAAAWLPLLDGWADERLTGILRYTRTTGEPAALPFAATLGHVFNHGTHHRGQVTAALTAMGRPCPEIDLAWMLQAESKAA